MSLTELSGEDDSLLHLPSDDSAFTFSPLHFPTSHLSTTSIKSNTRVLSASSHSNKGNLSAIDTNSGICNLSVERQKMKKSRKASGYNLRKSLAWNKAFFTEEGVLDPVELSMISGISLGDSLSVVDEERRDSLITASDVDRSSANIENLKENLDKDFPSGRPNKINKSSSLLNQESSPGSRLPILSRSSQKVPSGRGLNKSASKVAPCATPLTPSTQKRLLTGTPKVTTRSSKIPRVPLSKHPPLPSTTRIQAPSGGSHLKCAEIAQPVQKSIGLKTPSNIKYASKGANIRSGGASISFKQLGVNIGMDTTCSSLEMGSTANHKAQNTNKVNNYLQNNSNQNLCTVDETSKTKVSSQYQSDNGDGNKKDVQVQGIKPSGLRLPSPSMRFFSEGNMKSSNHKLTIPTSRNSKAVDHISEFKQIKDRHGSLNHDATSKKRLCSQVAESCSASSLVDPTAHADAMYGKCHQQKVQPRVLLRDKVPQPTNNVKCTKNIMKDIDNQHSNEILTSLKDEGKDAKCNVILSHAESVNINCSNLVFKPNGNSCGNMMNNSIASCHEVQLSVDFATNEEACSTFDEDTGCSSSTLNDRDSLESVTVLNSHHNNYTLAADCDPSTSMRYEDKTPGENKIDDSVQPSRGSMKLQLGGNKLLADDNCLLERDESESAEPVCVGGIVDVEISDGEKQGIISESERTVNTLSSNAVPFSDEWLAAIESAGEEILTKKTGAVQHSPTDKSVPEPSPWSPVKRKNNQIIGPFDCTKCTNTQPDQSQQDW